MGRGDQRSHLDVLVAGVSDADGPHRRFEHAHEPVEDLPLHEDP
jgi:hypothetical protein